MDDMRPFEYDALFVQCAGKLKHSSYGEAERRLKLQRKQGRNRSPMKPYRCEACGAWHVGGNSSRRLFDHKRKSG